MFVVMDGQSDCNSATQESMITDTMDCYTLFKGPCHQNVRISSDTEFWSGILHSLVDCETTYCKTLWNTLSTLEQRIDSPHIALKAKNCQEYRRFLQVISRLRNHVTEKGHVSCTMRDMYLKHLTNLQNFSTEARADFDVNIHKKAYSDLHKSFKDQEQSVEQFKEKYHNMMAEVENKELQYLFRNSESLRAQIRKDIKSNEEKVKRISTDYNHSVRVAKNKLLLLKSASKLFEESWKEREIRKTDLVIRTLESVRQNVNQCMASTETSTEEAVQVNVPAMVDDLREMQKIPDVEFEEYQKPILKLVQSKLMKKYSTADQTKSYEYDSDLVQRYVVTRPHKDKNPHCLLLKKGMKITELIPPTSKGWAFGEARKSEHSIPKFGFFHIACVEKL